VVLHKQKALSFVLFHFNFLTYFGDLDLRLSRNNGPITEITRTEVRLKSDKDFNEGLPCFT
jgi:hypothetical protein